MRKKVLVTTFAVMLPPLLWWVHSVRQDDLPAQSQSQVKVRAAPPVAQAVQPPPPKSTAQTFVAPRETPPIPIPCATPTKLDDAHKLMGSGNWREAAVLLEEFLVSAPQDQNALRDLGWIYFRKLASAEQAAPLLLRALEQNPGDRYLAAELTEIYTQEQRLDDLKREFQRLLGKSQAGESLKLAAGNILMQQNRPEEALAAYQDALQDANFSDPEAFLSLARAQMQIEPQGAVTSLQQLLGHYGETLAVLKEQGNQTDEVDRDIEHAKLMLAKAYRASGHPREADGVLSGLMKRF